MRTARISAFALVAALASGSELLAAEPSTVAVRRASLDVCLTQAVAYAETIGVFRSEIAAAQASLAEARSRSYPQLSVVPGMRCYIGESGMSAEASADFGEHLLEIPQNVARRRIARGEVVRAAHKTRYSRCRHLCNVLRAYVSCLKAQQGAQLSRDCLPAAEQIHAAWQLVTEQNPKILEHRRMSATMLEERRAAGEQAAQMHRTLSAQLSTLCGYPSNVALVLADVPVYALPPVTLDRCQTWALTNRGDLLATRCEAELLRQAARLVRLDRLPSPQLSVGYTEESTQDDQEGVFARLGLKFRVWDGGETSARADKLQAQADGRKLEILAAETEIRTAVARAFMELQQAALARKTLAEDRKPREEATIADIRWRNGAMSRAERELAALRQAEHQVKTQERNLSCYEAEAALLEAIEATREQLAAGLPGPNRQGVRP